MGASAQSTVVLKLGPRSPGCVGLAIKVVQEELGHARISTAMDLYAHVMPSSRRELPKLSIDYWLSRQTSAHGVAGY